MKLSESVEEYLEALYVFLEEGKDIVRVKEMAEALKITPASVVEMFRKLESFGLIEYTRDGAKLTDAGIKEAERIVRNHRLVEVLLDRVLKVSVDEEVVCRMEHTISSEIADAICTLLNHPKECPHGKPIPRGECCPK